MSKRKYLLFFALMIAMVTVFAATDVLAQCVAPDCAVLGDCEISIVRGNDGEYPIFVNTTNQADYPVYADACLNFDPDNSGQLDPIGLPCGVFAFQFAGSCTYSQYAQALLDPAQYCPDDQYSLIKTTAIAAWAEAGAGDSDTKIHQGDDSVRVLEYQNNLDGGQVYFYLTSANVSALPAHVWLKQGKKIYHSTLLASYCWVPPPPVVPGVCRTHEVPKFGPDKRPAEVEFCVTNGVPTVSAVYTDTTPPTTVPSGDYNYATTSPGGNKLCAQVKNNAGTTVVQDLGCAEDFPYELLGYFHHDCPECLTVGTGAYAWTICWPDPSYCQ